MRYKVGCDKSCFIGIGKRNITHSKISSGENGVSCEWDIEDEDLPLPLWQQVIDWFLEKHKLFIFVHPYYGVFVYDILKENRDYGWISTRHGLAVKEFETTNKAKREAILEAIKLLK